MDKRLLLFIFTLALSLYARAAEPADSTEDRNWWHLLKKGKLRMDDKTVEYPAFLGFCVDVYNWGDRTFNSYDTTYVAGTGKKWKARLLSDNSVDSYYLNIHRKLPIRMMSDPVSNLGAYLQFMAVSVGYSLDMSNIIGNKPTNYKKFGFNFNCARFNIDAYYWSNNGSTFIRTFGNYNRGHLTKKEFNGAEQRTLGVSGYYFFNNRKFSMGAAYNYSRLQRRSAGSAIIGFNYTSTNIRLNLKMLPPELLPYLNHPPEDYRFHYDSYCLMSGYSYNWVWNKHLLFNITAFPGVGYTHTYEDSVEKSNKLFALTLKGQSSITYNLGDFFVCAVAKIDGNWYNSGSYSFLSAVENAQINVGIRF